MNKGGPSGSTPATASKGAGKSGIHFADTQEAINDNVWHGYLQKQGDTALNATLVGFVTAVPLHCPGPAITDADWKSNKPTWGVDIIDAWQ